MLSLSGALTEDQKVRYDEHVICVVQSPLRVITCRNAFNLHTDRARLFEDVMRKHRVQARFSSTTSFEGLHPNPGLHEPVTTYP